MSSDTGREAMRDERYASWKGWDVERFGRWSRREARYFAWHVARCGLAGPASGRHVLEIGYGNGAFIGWAKDRGFEVSGIEAQPVLLRRARDAGWRVAANWEELDTASSFDLIVAIDVLEHLNPDQCSDFLAQAVRCLAPAGRLLLRVPNGDSPFGRTNQHGDLTHVTVYGLSKLRQLAAMHGLEVVAHGEAPWTCMQGLARNFTGLLRAAARAVLESWIRFAYGWDSLSLAPNLVVVLRRGRP